MRGDSRGEEDRGVLRADYALLDMGGSRCPGTATASGGSSSCPGPEYRNSLAGANVTEAPAWPLAAGHRSCCLDKLEEQVGWWQTRKPSVSVLKGAPSLPGLTAGTLVKDILVHSANDAAWALAKLRQVRWEFVQLMNAKAAGIGLQQPFTTR